MSHPLAEAIHQHGRNHWKLVAVLLGSIVLAGLITYYVSWPLFVWLVHWALGQGC